MNLSIYWCQIALIKQGRTIRFRGDDAPLHRDGNALNRRPFRVIILDGIA
jgi:hypothetical protein